MRDSDTTTAKRPTASGPAGHPPSPRFTFSSQDREAIGTGLHSLRVPAAPSTSLGP